MMRFLMGVVVGWAAANWYYTNGESVTALFDQMWENASAPPTRMERQDAASQSAKGKRF
jgi:hypothetical protein